MKRLFIVLFSSCILIVTIYNAKAQQDIRNNFFVSKIYDYKNVLLAEYFYNNDCKLVKKIVTDFCGVNRIWVDSFVYVNGRVSKIIHDDQTYDFDYEINVLYNSNGQLIRSETYKNNLLVLHSNFYYENNHVVSIYNDNTIPFESDSIVYDASGNVTQHIHIYQKYDEYGIPIQGEHNVFVSNYEYDNGLRANFGIDYLFIYNPLPYSELAEFENNLSENNMIKAFSECSSWIYTYYDNGLPKTIQTIWDSIPTVNPMILRIEYKQVETGISEKEKENGNINIYPNPVESTFSIDVNDFDYIEIYNIFYQEVLSQKAIPKTKFDISMLPSGIYSIIIFSKNKIVGNSKIIKQ